MEIQKKFFPSILPENEITYFGHLEGIISAIDEHCNVLIIKNNNSYNFRIATSLPKYNNLLIKHLINFHNVFNIHLDFSKSIKTSSIINFKINL